MQIIGRIFLLLFGLALIMESTLAPSKHTVTVNGRGIHNGHYRLDFVGETTTHCDAGYIAYNAVTDGESVTLASSLVLNQCLHLVRSDGQVVHMHEKRWHWAIIGLVLLAAGLGWIRSDAGTIIIYGR